MKQVTVTYNVYEFDELSGDAKQRALEQIVKTTWENHHAIITPSETCREYWYRENGDIFSPAEPKHEWTAEEITRREG